MAILALSLSILLRFFSTGLRNIDVSNDYARAMMIAEAQLDSAATSPPFAPVADGGVIADKFRWSRTVEDYRPFADTEVDNTVVPIDAYAVTVIVEWPHANNTRRVSLAGITLAESRRTDR